MIVLDSLTDAERQELDNLVECLASAIVRTLIVEVDEPLVRRLALARAAGRLGLHVEKANAWLLGHA